ncbi:MAG TPA: TIGR02391 family protein [Terriglobales bacterium]|jgi:uncharacterized protein (TIGR02391 family)|nr:TIGR02391 family protein [Terriglobales bacterium]
MANRLKGFEATVRALSKLALPGTVVKIEPASVETQHPFDTRNIHPKLPPKVRKLFDDGHFAEATSHAFKFLDKKVEKYSGLSDSGFSLMMEAFNSKNPKIQLTPLKTQSEQDEQEGYRFVFAGGIKAIRNPRAHEFSVVDGPDTCLDHLSFVSLLLRRLEQAGFA